MQVGFKYTSGAGHLGASCGEGGPLHPRPQDIPESELTQRGCRLAGGTRRLLLPVGQGLELSEEVTTPLRHERYMLGATLNGDKSRILTWSNDGRPPVRHLPPAPRKPHRDRVRDAARARHVRVGRSLWRRDRRADLRPRHASARLERARRLNVGPNPFPWGVRSQHSGGLARDKP